MIQSLPSRSRQTASNRLTTDNVRYLKGDGHSFAGISDSSTTAIFCYDAMVQFSPEIVKAYLKDAARILKRDGRMLLHHSTCDAPTDQHYRLNPHARNHMNQKLLAQLSAEAKLLIEEQVVIAWGHEEDLVAISLLHKPKDPPRATAHSLH